jgi:glutamine cyclotransferase
MTAKRLEEVKRAFLLVILLFLAVLGCDQPVPTQEYTVIRNLPHDPKAYTQGLVFREGILFESTGRRGASSIRRVDLESEEILSIRKLPKEYFGEGLALVGSDLVQLTWKSGVAFVYDRGSLELLRTFEYTGEGWGLCFDGEFLFMSDGSDKLLKRDSLTFEIIKEIQVTKNGRPVSRLNELECVGDEIFANVYQTDRIVRIDKQSGEVKAEIDAQGLSLVAPRTTDPEAVFNGIAFDPATGHFFVTGKLWPNLFEIEIQGR